MSGPVTLTIERVPGAPAIDVMHFEPNQEPSLPGPHSHTHLALAYFERDGGWVGFGADRWQLRAGDVFVVAPGEIYDPAGLTEAQGWAVFFPPDALDIGASAVLSWRAHPLLFPFTRGGGDATRRLRVQMGDRGWWSRQMAELQSELRDRRDGYEVAAPAILTQILVATGRLASDLVGALKGNDEPLLARVFEVIERRYPEPISLRSVAADVNLTSGHLTTVVRRKTGRTVQGWIIERRMVEARRLLATTDLSVDEVARRAGYSDTPYFVRSFKKAHSVTPLTWRRGSRPSHA